MKKIYNFISKYKKEIIVILILIIICIYFYYRENFISEGFTGETSGSLQFSRIATNEFHSLALTTDGKVYAWGWNGYGQLGLNDTIERSSPALVTYLSTITVSAIAVGQNHSLALTNDGKVYAWGSGSAGKLGLGLISDKEIIPKLIPNFSSVSAIAVGESHSLALTNDGNVYAWGWNGSAQLGLDDTNLRTSPTRILSLSNISRIFTGYSNSFVLKNDGTVYAWGANSIHQLGLEGDYNLKRTPVLISRLSSMSISVIAASEDHSLGLTTNGKVYAWGYNMDGQLGLGYNSHSKYDVTLVTAFNNITVSGIAAGQYHSLAFTTNGEVYAWGKNTNGQLGLGDTNPRNTPTRVTDLSNFSGISCGYIHSHALTYNGEVYAWGNNGSARLGLGDYRQRITPELIPNPINCVGDFVNDGVCSEPCGGGKQKQIYDITTPAQLGGETCPHQEGEEKEIDCNIQPCPIDCVGDYEDLGVCSTTCGPGTQQQKYKISQDAVNGGVCPNENTTRNIPCNIGPCPVNCVGDYVDSGVCSTTCGPGTQQQEYKISQSAVNGGVCPNENTTRNISCNIGPCPIDCVGSFGEYETCSVGCGGGTQSRTYTITKGAQHEGLECPHQDGDTEERQCNTDPCHINCNGGFENLGECSRECGGGVLRQFYDITTEAQHGGGQCDHKQNDLKTIPCNTQPCPTYGENTLLQEALKESNNKIQNIRYNIIDRQEELDTLTNKFNRLNKNISKIKTSSNYVPDDKTLTFY